MRLPTRAQLDVLISLWRFGERAATGHEIRAAHGGHLAYATVLNHLKALWLKRLVHIAHGERGNTYTATCSCDQFMQQVLAELIGRFFAGEPDRLVSYVQARRIALSEPPESLIPLDLRIVR